MSILTGIVEGRVPGVCRDVWVRPPLQEGSDRAGPPVGGSQVEGGESPVIYNVNGGPHISEVT